MARGNKILTIKNFKGLKTNANATLVDPDVMVDVDGLKLSDGKLQQYGEMYSTASGVGANGFFDTQLLETRVENIIGFPDGMAVLCVTNGGNNVNYLNPKDYSQTARVYPVVQVGPYTADSDGNIITAAGCLITGWKHNSITREGDRLEIQKGSTANTFQHRVVLLNVAGSWSADVPVTTTGQSISVTINSIVSDLVVYFDSVSDFNSLGSGVQFSWSAQFQEYDTLHDLRPFAQKSFTYFDNQLFFFISGRLFYTNGSGIASAGYRPIYGSSVVNFYNHIVIGQYSERVEITDFNGYGARPVIDKDLFTLAWSHLRNPHDFQPTQFNEADRYFFDWSTEVREECAGITGLAVYDNNCYITTAKETYVMTYVGLPLVMQINRLPVAFSCGVLNCLTVIPRGLVAIDRRGYTLFFDGESPAQRDDSIQIDLGKIVVQPLLATIQDMIGNYAHLNYLEQTNEIVVSQAEVLDFFVATYHFSLKRIFYILSLDTNTWSKIVRTEYLDRDQAFDPEALALVVTSDYPDNLVDQLKVGFSNILPVRYTLTNEYSVGTTFPKFITAVSYVGDSALAYFSPDVETRSASTHPYAKFAINIVRPLYDLAEIRSIAIDASTGGTGHAIAIELKGYDSTFAASPLTTVSRSITLSAMSTKAVFHNVNAKGVYFELKVSFSGNAIKYAKINSITLTYRGDEQNVEK